MALRVGLAYNCFFGAFQKFFPELEIVPSMSAVQNYNLIIFSGGEDINPALYGQSNSYSYYDDERDTIEKRIFSETVQNHIKVFGVCRGHQLVNALLGGNLVQDIGYDLGGKHGGNHKLVWNSSSIPDANLRSTLPDCVNSLHHQAVIGSGNGLKNVAYAHVQQDIPTKRNRELSVYDIIEISRGPLILTVQFHPEFMGLTQFFDYIRCWVEDKPFKAEKIPQGITEVSPSKSKKTKETDLDNNLYFTTTPTYDILHRELESKQRTRFQRGSWTESSSSTDRIIEIFNSSPEEEHPDLEEDANR